MEAGQEIDNRLIRQVGLPDNNLTLGHVTSGPTWSSGELIRKCGERRLMIARHCKLRLILIL